MANPNIVNVANIYGKVTGLDVPVTLTDLVANAASSAEIYKINSIIVANVDGAAASDISCVLIKSGGASSIYLAHTIPVPADSTLVVLSKDTSIYLEEDDKIQVVASSASDLHCVCSYEVIS